MKTIFCSLIAASTLACAASARAQTTDAPAQPESGKVLLLDNERIVEGDIERDGNRYHVRRELGESWIPADKAIRLCASREDAFKFLRDRTNLRDLDERLKLARWCQLHGLREQGLAEVKAALELKPACSEAKRLLRCFERDAEPATPPAPAPVETSENRGPSEAKPAGHTPPEPMANAGLSMETSTMFATRVQPILMNTCISCHGSERGGSFRLIASYGDSNLSQRTTQLNLAAAAAQINCANWAASPLLAKATSIHGNMPQPALTGRTLPAFKTLEEWAQKVAADTPDVSPAAQQATGEVPFAVGATKIDEKSSKHEEKSHEAEPSSWAVDARPTSTTAKPADPTPAAEPAGKTGDSRDVPHTVSTTPPPKEPTEPVDEFDPIHFNRMAHPERVAE
jgi:hypothetical protein